MVKKTIFPHELIGEEIEIIASTNESNVGKKGKIVDETKSTIKLQHKNQTKTLMKSAITFKLIKTGQTIEGQDIIKRPEERLKGK